MRVNVFSQNKNRRVLVGQIWREKNEYCFQYNTGYIKLRSGIPLGVELPKYQTGVIRSKKLFPSLEERIPSRQNPEYPNYCRQWGISPEEQDQLILLVTIGNRGPSSFLFRKDEDILIEGLQINNFRQKLNLSLREFAVFLDVQPATLSKTEKGSLAPDMFLRLCRLLINVPQALGFQLKLRGQYLHDNKILGIKKYLENNQQKPL